MKLLLFLFGAALAAGLYFVLADLLKIPRLATERALISAGRKERSLVKSMETLVLGWSLKLAPLIRLDAYKRRRLETKLTAAGLDMTPEVYTRLPEGVELYALRLHETATSYAEWVADDNN